MQCVVLAGGLGTRMRLITEGIPKALIPVAGRPFVDLQLEWLAREGVEEVVFCIGYGGDLIRTHVGDGRRFGLLIEYVDEGPDLRGTGGALRLAFEHGALADSFFVLYGDSFLPIALGPVWKAFGASNTLALMTVMRNRGQWDRSNAAYANGLVTTYDKSWAGPGELEYIDYGLSVLSRRLVEGAISSGAVVDLATVFHELSLAGGLAGFEVQERFYEVGSPSGLAEIEAHLASQERDRSRDASHDEPTHL